MYLCVLFHHGAFFFILPHFKNIGVKSIQDFRKYTGTTTEEYTSLEKVIEQVGGGMTSINKNVNKVLKHLIYSLLNEPLIISKVRT